MLVSVSPVGIVKSRPGFGQTIRPVKGSIIASPVLADWNPEPDYFFHWFRDSAVVIDAVRLLFEAGDLGAQARDAFRRFRALQSRLQALDGRKVIATTAWRDKVTPDFVQFLRKDDELGAVHGDVGRRRDPGQSGRHARYLELDAPPTRRRAFAGALGVAMGQGRIRSMPSCGRWCRSWSGRTWRLHLRTGASRRSTSGRRRAVSTTTPCAFPRRRCGKGLTGWMGPASRPWREPIAPRRQSFLRVLDGYWLPEAGHYRSRVLASGTAVNQGARYRGHPGGDPCVG